MSVAASQAPDTPAKAKKGFEIPPLAEKLIIPLVVAVIAIAMPFFTDNQSFIQQCAVAVAYVVMALGHSSRDSFEMLHARGVHIEAKPFSIGFRVEQHAESGRVDEVDPREIEHPLRTVGRLHTLRDHRCRVGVDLPGELERLSHSGFTPVSNVARPSAAPTAMVGAVSQDRKSVV